MRKSAVTTPLQNDYVEIACIYNTEHYTSGPNLVLNVVAVAQNETVFFLQDLRRVRSLLQQLMLSFRLLMEASAAAQSCMCTLLSVVY